MIDSVMMTFSFGFTTARIGTSESGHGLRLSLYLSNKSIERNGYRLTLFHADIPF
jgi:hypothetical protein